MLELDQPQPIYFFLTSKSNISFSIYHYHRGCINIHFLSNLARNSLTDASVGRGLGAEGGAGVVVCAGTLGVRCTSGVSTSLKNGLRGVESSG